MASDVCPTTQGPHNWEEINRIERKHRIMILYKCSQCGQIIVES
jgi:hypothetical protein